jgi:type I restriction enzyme S subunit
MRSVALGDVAEFINGAAFKPVDWGEDGSRIIRIQNLNDPRKPYNRTTRQVPKKYEVPSGTLLVSWSASLGVFEWNEPDTALLNQHIFKVLPEKKVVRQDYLRLMLSKALIDMEKHAHGSTMLHVNRGEFLATEIPLPPLDEQKRIAAILDQADELRRKRQRAIDRLNQLGQAIFFEMFGDPVSPDANEAERLADMADLINGDRSSNYPSGDDIKDSGVLFLNTTNIKNGELDLSKSQFITEKKFASLSRGKLARHDLVITLRGTLGQCALFDCEFETGFINAQMMIIRCRDAIMPRYLKEYISFPSVQKELNDANTGSAVPQLTGTQMKEMQIIVPSLSEQKEFVSVVDAARNVLGMNILHRAGLDNLFSSLQHRAFQGEL